MDQFLTLKRQRLDQFLTLQHICCIIIIIIIISIFFCLRILPGIFLEDFLGTFSHRNEEKKSGDKIREKVRRLKNRNPREIRSAKKFSCRKFFQIRHVPTQIPGRPGHSLSKTAFFCPKTLSLGCFSLPEIWATKQKICSFKKSLKSTEFWRSPKPIHLKPGHLKMRVFSAHCRLDGAFFV